MLDERSWGPTDLSRRTEELGTPVSVAAISAMMARGSAASAYAPVIAEALGVNTDWLIAGRGSKNRAPAKRPPTLYAMEPGVMVEPVPHASRVPLISWVAAGAWSEAFDPYAPGAAESWIDAPGHHSPNAFALRVRGDSMEPRFPDGCVIIVEPHREPKPGQFVVVRNNDWDEATFKQFDRDGPIKLLKPLNPRYPVQQLGPGTVLVGVVVRKYVDESI